MFHRSPRATQERMLADALIAVVDHLEDAPWLAEKLGALGESTSRTASRPRCTRGSATPC